MTDNTTLSEDQLTTLATAPNGAFIVLLGADPANPISMLREGRALAKGVKKSRKDSSYPPIVATLVDHLDAHQKEIGERMPSLDSIDEAVEVGRGWLRGASAAAATLSPEDRAGFTRWVLDLAQAGAEAVNEKDADHRVSPGEKKALEEIESILRGGQA